MLNRLNISDVLYPLEAFFNRLTSEQFILALQNFSEGRGYNPEDINCFFPIDLSEDEFKPVESYDYIELWTYSNDQEIKVEFSEFIKYMQQAAQKEIEIKPESERDILKLVNEAKSAIENLNKEHLVYASK